MWKAIPASLAGDSAKAGGVVAEHGQDVAQVAVRGLYDVFNIRYASVRDLTSDRLFRFFQPFSVDTPCVTISGSYGNYLTPASLTGSVAKVAGIQIEKPHDAVVQDDSVDLGESVLPHEFSNHQHFRRYRDCIDAHHCDLYTREAVHEIIRMSVRAWIG
jgi:hypothetical protein